MSDSVEGLNCGGDDYVTKPFSLDEVMLRIGAILRRVRPLGADLDDGVLRFADLELDEVAHAVRRAGLTIELSPTEFALLRHLMINAERVVGKAQISDRVWAFEFDRDGRSVESTVSNLRRKIDGVGPPLIHALHGVGYRLQRPG